MHVDVIILGSGPAGVAAAITCCRAGLSVAVVTKQTTNAPVAPAPVQSIHPGVVSLLQQLALDQTLAESTRSRFDRIQVNGKENHLAPSQEAPWYGHHIDRELWDQALLQHLNQLPIHVLQDTRIPQVTRGSDNAFQVATDQNPALTSDYLIDASGARRLSRHLLQLEEVFLTAPMTCWTGRARSLNEYPLNTQFSMQETGWTWLATEDCHVVTWNTLQQVAGNSFQHPLPQWEQLGNPHAYNVRWRVFRPVCDQQVLLCGDAAGMLDPAAGQGILNALLSGMQAGQCLAACQKEPEMEAWHFAMYDQWFIEQYEQKVSDLAAYYKAAGINILLRPNEKTVHA